MISATLLRIKFLFSPNMSQSTLNLR